MTASITFGWLRTGGANCVVHAKSPRAGQTNSSACSGLPGPIHGRGTTCAERASASRGDGYELTDADVIDAYNHFMAAAQTLGIAPQARADMLAIATKQPGAAFSDILIRQVREAPGKAIRTEQQTWTRRSTTRR